MNQEFQSLVFTNDISQIFPDIEGQLCTRHSALFGKLKCVFSQLYDSKHSHDIDLSPSHYVIVKGATTACSIGDVSLSLALENGIVLLVRRTYKKQRVFLNGKHIEEEIIFTENGLISEGLHQWAADLQSTFQKAIEDVPQEKLYGGIIYIHSNIPQTFFQYKQAMLIAFFLGIMILNDSLGNFTMNQILQKMSSCKNLGSYLFIEKQFKGFKNRNLHLEMGNKSCQIPLEEDLKLIFCRIDLAPQQILYQKQVREKYEKVKESIRTNLKAKYQVSSLNDVYQEKLSIYGKKFPAEDEKLFREVLNMEMKQLSLLCKYKNHEISFSQLIRRKWELDSNAWKYYPEEVLQLVDQIKKNILLQSFIIVNSTFLLIPVLRRTFTTTLCQLRQLCHRGELKSISRCRLEQRPLESKWNNDQDIGEKIFLSVPSKGVAIYDPTGAIWFD